MHPSDTYCDQISKNPKAVSGLEEAQKWASLEEDRMRRLAQEAVRLKQEPELWSLTLAHIVLHGVAGGGVSWNTCRCSRAGIRTLLTAWQDRDLAAPGRDAGAPYVRRLEASGLRPSSIGIRLTAAKQLYKALRWTGATSVDPFLGVRAPRDPTAPWDRRQPYAPTEIARMLGAASTVDKIVILLGAHGGFRASEMLALRWENIDPDARRIHILDSKGGKARFVSASASLMLALLQINARDGFVLPFRSYSRLAKRVYSICDCAGVPRRGVHSLRHHAGTKVMSRLGDLEAVARHLGHTNLETARIYAKWSDARLHDEVGNW